MFIRKRGQVCKQIIGHLRAISEDGRDISLLAVFQKRWEETFHL
jgi:hypothetical protein